MPIYVSFGVGFLGVNSAVIRGVCGEVQSMWRDFGGQFCGRSVYLGGSAVSFRLRRGLRGSFMR